MHIISKHKYCLFLGYVGRLTTLKLSSKVTNGNLDLPFVKYISSKSVEFLLNVRHILLITYKFGIGMAMRLRDRSDCVKPPILISLYVIK